MNLSRALSASLPNSGCTQFYIIISIMFVFCHTCLAAQSLLKFLWQPCKEPFTLWKWQTRQPEESCRDLGLGCKLFWCEPAWRTGPCPRLSSALVNAELRYGMHCGSCSEPAVDERTGTERRKPQCKAFRMVARDQTMTRMKEAPPGSWSWDAFGVGDRGDD